MKCRLEWNEHHCLLCWEVLALLNPKCLHKSYAHVWPRASGVKSVFEPVWLYLLRFKHSKITRDYNLKFMVVIFFLIYTYWQSRRTTIHHYQKHTKISNCIILALKVPNKNCSRRHFNFSLLSFKENKAWFFMRILFTWNIKSYFLWKTLKKYLWMLSAAVMIGV